MQWLTNLPLGDNRTLQIAVLCVVAIVAIVALIIAYRALFGHRLRFSGGGRARQPRLGLVDAFSLDGQRQLVLVRRDNVEFQHAALSRDLFRAAIRSRSCRSY